MPPPTLAVVEQVIRASWSPASCDPVDLADWSPANPARGQCGVTALVLQDHLGGDLLMAEVRHADGSRQGVHYWNRLDDGAELDLTREQFLAAEVVLEPRVVHRPPDISGGRLYEQYTRLATRVRDGLARDGGE
ncbi:hypothetical protein DSM104299_03446 [Baekduia alba]|uniref:YunG family protein n=1 Tax=Baekduia alba TaxID=2997333 RepID=UPI00233FF91F|nr:hypothetical protein [Baekduia alba]WCB94707.1 hypothetical protein DSM104299_03446 [Baekduia alba]